LKKTTTNPRAHNEQTTRRRPEGETGESWVWLARIRRTQGRKGEVFAEILTDFPEKFGERKRLWLVRAARPDRALPANVSEADVPLAREMELAAHWLHKGGIVLHFAGVDSISAAEELMGRIVAVPRAERVALGEDEAYISDLIGCTLVDVSGAEPFAVGAIEDVDLDAGPTPLLIVAGKRGEILVPFAKSYLRRIDLSEKCLEMVLPEGLAELNAPPKS
jgi:16S rRNA processing protein RimM